VRDAGEIERDVAAFARSANGGLIVTGSNLVTLHRDLIITLAARHKLPAIYYERFFVAAGGLGSYGPNFVDQYRRAAGAASSGARNRPICQCRRRPGTNC
jgi:putative ABC transport system substrate-binding protein